MRIIDSGRIKEAVKDLCLQANICLRKDILLGLQAAIKKEAGSKARRILSIIIDNAALAKKKRLPICQDTGMVLVYLKIGRDVRIKGDVNKAIERGVKEAYRDGYFRKSIVKDPFIRKNTNTNLPPVVYTQIVAGKKIDIRVSIKGFGCENANRIKMFSPADSMDLLEDFIVDTVRISGSRACPPLYIGVGIGGTLDKAVALSKEAVFRKVNEGSKKPHIARLERSVLRRINNLKIGPMGVGGKTTALGVSILTYPTHIAGMPVAVNISCHAARDARKVI